MSTHESAPSTRDLAAEVDLAFLRAVGAMTPVPERLHPEEPLGGGLTGARALELFDAQLGSRHLDLAARWLRQKRGAGFYTIGSSGHEGNACVAAALRPTDPALLHYRSGAFFLERARQVPGIDALYDVLLGICAASEEPIAGGRHKVFGHHALAVIPQTSTIASQLPRALGVAFAIERSKKLGARCAWPRDAIAITSFGDASANHSTAAGAINAACHSAHAGHPLPLLFLCEDNGIGISVSTPAGWIRAAYGSRPGLKYFEADGGDLLEASEVSREAAAWVRANRRPAFLHLRVVRLMGHAGSDAEATYRTPDQISAEIARDPLVRTAAMLVERGVLTPSEVIARYEEKRDEVVALSEKARLRPQLTSAAEVMAPLSPRRPAEVAKLAGTPPDPLARGRVHEGKMPEDEGPLTLSLALNRTLADLFAAHTELLVFGEDVGKKGGVYGVTKGLSRRVGPARVFDTLLDEQTILGLALGTSVSGLLPIPEIQYLAYLHNAEDQLRGEAASLSFFSNGQYKNGMVVRIAGYGYQKGFGGHFHNDDAIAVLRDIPGIVVASPARPDDAAAMLRTCVAAAKVDGTVCVFLEPIALYHTRDLHAPNDGGWLAPYPPADHHVPIGRGRTYGSGEELTIVTSGNGLFMSLRVQARLAQKGVKTRVLDLRWLLPLPEEDLLREARATGRVLVVDETRKTGGISEGVITALVDHGFVGSIRRVASADSFVPLGDAALTVLLDEDTIERAALAMVGGAAV
jgi:2-oxoisovalerate dehydrogenase E1 component